MSTFIFLDENNKLTQSSAINTSSIELSQGNITSAHGTINFNDEHLTTTGNITGNNIEVSAGGITSDHGTINFNDENLTTTGNITGNSLQIADITSSTSDISFNNKNINNVNLLTTSSFSTGNTNSGSPRFSIKNYDNTGSLYIFPPSNNLNNANYELPSKAGTFLSYDSNGELSRNGNLSIDGGGLFITTTGSDSKIKITRTNAAYGGYMDIGMTYDDGGSRGATGMINVVKNSTNTSAPNFSLYLESNEKLTVLSNGNVGIGTTAPNEKLHVNGNIKVDGNITSNILLCGEILNDAAGAIQYPYIWLGRETFIYADSRANTNKRRIGMKNNTNSGYTYFSVSNSTQECILELPDRACKLIGTTSGSSDAIGKLTVYNPNSYADAPRTAVDGGDLTIIGKVYGYDTSGPTIMFKGHWHDHTNNNTGSSTYPWRMATIHATETGDYGGHLIFSTTLGDPTDLWNRAPEERMRLTSDGNIGIGTSSPNDKLHVNGNIRANGALVVQEGVDSSSTIGVCRIGYVGHGYFAGFAHKDRAAWGDYALLQQSEGHTYLNTRLGHTMHFRENNLDKMVMKGGNLGIGTSEPGEKLTISGTNPIIHFNGDWNVNNYFRIIGNDHGKKLEFNYNHGTILADNNAIIFQAGGYNSSNQTHTERMRIEDNGNIGIGTTAPNEKLHVNGNIKADGALVVQEGANSSSTIGYARIGDVGHQGDGVVSYAGFAHRDTAIGTDYAFLQDSLGHTFINCKSQTSIFFREANADKMVLKGGNLGIGTTNPTYNLDVQGNIRISGDMLVHEDISSSSGNLILHSSNQTRFKVGGSDRLYINSSGNIGIGTTSPGANYKLDVRGNVKISDQFECANNSASFKNIDSYTYFFNPSGTNGAASFGGSYFTYHNNGTAIYFNLSSGASSAGAYFSFATNNSQKARIDMTGSGKITGSWTGSWGGTSDRRLKENIIPIENAVDTLMKINVYQFDKYDIDNYDVNHHEEGEDTLKPFKKRLSENARFVYGFIAQELCENTPEIGKMCVETNDWGEEEPAYIIDDRPILACAIKTIQTQQEEINTLKQEVNTYKLIIDKLTSATSFEEFKNSL